MSMLFSGRYPAGASSVPLARHDVIDALTAAEFTDPDLHSRVALTLSEATGNVACHAYPHGGNEYMEVVVNETAGTVMIAVTDYGVGMNSTRVGLPSMGLGLPTMRAQTTSVEVRSDTNGTIVTLHFAKAHPGATDVVWADVPADGGSVPPMVLLSRSRLAKRMQACRADGQRLYPDGFSPAAAKAVEPIKSGEK